MGVFELNRYERGNNTQLLDQVKIAVLMNETKGPLQQHLHLMAGATPTSTDIRSTSRNTTGQLLFLGEEQIVNKVFKEIQQHLLLRPTGTLSPGNTVAELYAINTGATEALQIRSLLMELLNINKVHIRIHTDSSSGKSMATRIGSSRKAKHIELKHLFIQQLISHDFVRLIKIHTNDNPADILTKYVSTETLQRHLQQVGLGIQPLNLH